MDHKMLFQPHPVQLQALRTAKRFREGFRPEVINGQPLLPNSVFRNQFRQVPSQVLNAEIDHLCNHDERIRLVDDLCNRGYFRKQEGYPKCVWAPMEYQTEDGAKIYVHDEDWGEIRILRPDASLPNGKVRVRRCISGTQARIVFPVASTVGSSVPTSKGRTPTRGSNRSRKHAKGGPGSCYELLPEGFRLLDQLEQGAGPGGGKQKPKRPAWERLTLHRSSDGSDHTAVLDGNRIKIRGDAALKMLDILQKKKGERVKALVLQTGIRQRPDRVVKLLDRKLRRIIDPPKKGGVGYAML